MLATEIARLRQAQGLTQEGLAQAAKVSLPTIQRIEQDRHGDLRARTICRLERTLKVQPAALYLLICGASEQGQS